MLVTLFASLAGSTVLRAALAAATSLAFVLWFLPRLVRLARERRFGDRDDKSCSDTLDALHKGKRSTPIVGGIAILTAATLASLLFGDLGQPTLWVLLASLLGLGALGFTDDIAKTFGARRTVGLTARQKLAGQVVVGLAVGGFLLGRAAFGAGGGLPSLAALTTVRVPFLGLGLGVGSAGFLLLSVFLVTGSSNAVNLTDGLDGLAGGCALVAFAVYLCAAALAADPAAARSLGILATPGASEVCVVLAALSGAVTGFLVFNRHPAQVFMGDTGSLPLGGVLAVSALLVKQELLLALVGGVFVVEALSVMAQVASYKLFGKRVLRCAPLHHHFEFSGWKESQIVNGFHGVALFLGLLGLVGLVGLGL